MPTVQKLCTILFCSSTLMSILYVGDLYHAATFIQMQKTLFAIPAIFKTKQKTFMEVMQERMAERKARIEGVCRNGKRVYKTVSYGLNIQYNEYDL